MRSRLVYALSLVVVLIVLGTHVSELFDTWDDTLTTGNDIELSLAIMALSVGSCAILIRLIFKLFLNAVSRVWRSLQGSQFSVGVALEFHCVVIYSSPPPLRI
jgi:hypothetical protein